LWEHRRAAARAIGLHRVDAEAGHRTEPAADGRILKFGQSDASDVSVVGVDVSDPTSLCGDFVIQTTSHATTATEPGMLLGKSARSSGVQVRRGQPALRLLAHDDLRKRLIEAPSRCDDGKHHCGRRLSATCTVEPGYACDKNGCKPHHGSRSLR